MISLKSNLTKNKFNKRITKRITKRIIKRITKRTTKKSRKIKNKQNGGEITPKILIENGCIVNSVAWSPDGKKIAIGGFNIIDKKITTQIYDLESNKIIYLGIDKDHVNLLLWTKNSKSLISFNNNEPNGTLIKLWDIESQKLKKKINLNYLSYNIKSMALSPDKTKIIIPKSDKTIIYDIKTKTEKKLKIDNDGTSSINLALWSNNGKIIACNNIKNIHLFDGKTFMPLNIPNNINILKGHTDGIQSFSFSYDDKILASASGDKTVRLWDLMNGNHLHTFTKSLPFLSVAWSPISLTLVAGCQDMCIYLWDLKIKNNEEQSNEKKGLFSSLFSSGLSSNVTIVKNEILKVNKKGIFTISWNPNGKQIVSGSEKMVLLWNLQ